jgi:CheY-like chemotaxis protein
MAYILVVDDDVGIRDVVSAILEIEGHEVRTAGNGLKALEELSAHVPDLVLLDLQMPEMDGWRLLDELYVRGLRDQTRIVLMSGAIDQAARSRVRHVLPKPFEPEDLLAVVDEVMRWDPAELVEALDRTDALARLLTGLELRMR